MEQASLCTYLPPRQVCNIHVPPFAAPGPSGSGRKKEAGAFQLSFPVRTGYMHARIKRTLPSQIFAFTLCLRIKAGAGPAMGTPFSYSAPGQANQVVLIEWGGNPVELLVDDQVRWGGSGRQPPLPLKKKL